MKSFLPEPRLGWDSLDPFPDTSDFRSCLCEKKAQILPELLDPFQSIVGTPVRVHFLVSAGGPVCRAHMAALRSNLTRTQGCQSMTSCKMCSREQKVLRTIFNTDLQSFRTSAHVV